MKKDTLYRILIMIVLFILLLITRTSDQIFGSSIDWINQHVVFADYLRNLFYETGNIFSNFSMHLGLGENIYYISYYGLYNPVILLSFLFPKVPMLIYFQIINIVLYLGSSLLFYHFLKKHFSSENALIGTLLFSLSAPILFHFHKQIMFVNYMPYLILGLLGVDKYFEKNKSWLMILSVFLMILTSYYYSITGILVLVIYGVYVYLKQQEKFEIKDFIISGLKFLVPIILGILLSGVLLVPTAYALFSGRSEVVNEVTKYYFLPDIKLENFLYSDYTLGFTLIAILAFISLILIKNKKLLPEKFLTITVFIIGLFPCFSYILNGFIYARGKILIPFVPLVILIILLFINNLNKISKKTWEKIILISLTLMLVAYYMHFQNTKYENIILIDFILLNIGLIIFFLKKDKKWLIIFSLLISFYTSYYSNINENYVKYQTIYNSENQALEELITTTVESDNSWYRFNNLVDTYNKMNVIYHENYYTNSIYSSSMNSYYYNFYKNILEVNMPEDNGFIVNSGNNIIFEVLTGTKYIASDYPLSNYYQKLVEKNNIKIYQNHNTLSLGYATNKTFDSAKLEKFDYPSRINLLTQGVGVENSNLDSFEPIIEEVTLDTLEDFYKDKHLEIKNYATKDIINNTNLDGKVLILSFNVNGNTNCSTEKRTITINGIKEMISCDKWLYANHNYQFTYVITNPDTLHIEISKGSYDLTNIKTYTLDYSKFLEYVTSVDKLENVKIYDNIITGSIKVSEDSYFVTSLPYDEGYKILIDGKEVEKELINKSFLGSKITKGEHQVEIIYTSSGFKLGSMISIFGLLVTIFIIIKENNKKKRV